MLFQSTPPVRGATRDQCARNHIPFFMFQSTPPVRGATSRSLPLLFTTFSSFNPRPPCGGRPRGFHGHGVFGVFQSTPPVRGATHVLPEATHGGRVSIHAPRAGGDLLGEPVSAWGSGVRVSIHAPRAGGDDAGREFFEPRRVSIHAPRAGGDKNPPPLNTHQAVSIHAPRAGGDVSAMPVMPVAIAWFQSTPPVRGATCGAHVETTHDRDPFQSTPPVRGATPAADTDTHRVPGFNPRPPCGGRLKRHVAAHANHEFQSTPPVRGATCRRYLCHAGGNQVSIHAPRAGGDCVRVSVHVVSPRGFNPRPPCGGRRRRAPHASDR